ncbi:hypothetical protein JFN87_32985, partial [Streptomyces bomunensis]|nr:hypothetical protein [Streptomyces montanisoli]
MRSSGSGSGRNDRNSRGAGDRQGDRQADRQADKQDRRPRRPRPEERRYDVGGAQGEGGGPRKGRGDAARGGAYVWKSSRLNSC